MQQLLINMNIISLVYLNSVTNGFSRNIDLSKPETHKCNEKFGQNTGVSLWFDNVLTLKSGGSNIACEFPVSTLLYPGALTIHVDKPPCQPSKCNITLKSYMGETIRLPLNASDSLCSRKKAILRFQSQYKVPWIVSVENCGDSDFLLQVGTFIKINETSDESSLLDSLKNSSESSSASAGGTFRYMLLATVLVPAVILIGAIIACLVFRKKLLRLSRVTPHDPNANRRRRRRHNPLPPSYIVSGPQPSLSIPCSAVIISTVEGWHSRDIANMLPPSYECAMKTEGQQST